MSTAPNRSMLGIDANGYAIQTGRPDSSKDQNKAVGAASARSDAFDNGTRLVMFLSDTDFHIAFGDDTVVATTTNLLLKANALYTFPVNQGDRIAFIRASVDGNIRFSEIGPLSS